MNIFKRSALILSVLAAACVLFALAASAETYASDSAAVAGGAVARIGAEGSGTYYADFAAAIGAARNGDTVTLLANTATAPVTVSADVTVTGNHTLTRASGHTALLTVKSGANLTLDGVSVSSSTGSTILVSADASLTLKGAFSVDATGGGTVISVNAGSTVTVEGTGTVGSSGVEYALNVSGGTSDNPAVISIKGGEIRAHNPIVIRTASTVTMDGGSLVAVNGGSCLTLNAASHTVTINGGNIMQQGTATCNGINVKAATTAKITINDVNADLYGSCFLSDAATTTAIDLTINGGTFRSKSAYNTTLCGGKNCKSNILGGTFIGCTDTADGTVRVVGVGGEAPVMNIYGGYFRNGVLFCVRPEQGAILNVYGGEFDYAPDLDTNTGCPIPVGTAAAGATANIYGGNFHTGTAYYSLINNAGAYSTFNVYAATGNGGYCLALKNSGTGKDVIYPHGQDRITLNGIEMLAGATPRFKTDGNGLRFCSTISKATIDYLAGVADEGSVSYGTLIVPADYLSDLYAFTIYDLERSGKPYVNIPAVDGITQNGNRSVTICAALIRIKEANLGRNFVARSYISYTVNGNPVVQYSDFRETKNSRNLRTVSAIALDDVSSVKNNVYCYTVSEGVYSPYPVSQRAVLTACRGDMVRAPLDVYIIAGQSNGAGYARWVEEFAAAYPQAGTGYDNIYYSGAACVGGTRVNNIEDFSKVKVGLGKDHNFMGAEVGMADALSAYYNPTSGKEAAIIRYAVGATCLRDTLGGANGIDGNWAAPSYLEKHGAAGELSGGLYRLCLAQVASSVDDYRGLGYDVSIKGIFWMQGEGDYNVAGILNAYPEMLDMLIGDFRRDLGNLTGEDLSDLLFVIGEISEAFGCVHNQALTDFVAMQDAYAASHDHVSVVQSGPMNTGTDGGDSAHWTCDDMMLIGRMVGTEIINNVLGGSAQMPYLTGTPVAEVYDKNGTLIGTYSHLDWAINTAPAGATVKLISDVTVYSSLNLCNTKPVTVNGNGHNIISYAYGRGINLVTTDITFVDFKVDLRRDGVDAAYALYVYDNAKAVFEGNCSFNAYKYGFVLNQTCDITIRGNTTITTRMGGTRAQAAIHISATNLKLNIEGGVLTGVNAGAAIIVNDGATGVINISGGTFDVTTRAAYAIECLSSGITINLSGSPVISSGASGTITSKGTIRDNR